MNLAETQRPSISSNTAAADARRRWQVGWLSFQGSPSSLPATEELRLLKAELQ